MSKKWQIFEKECFDYLNDKYSKTTFKAYGESDSTLPDIYVIPLKQSSFYIEIKSKKSQCGQFVLIPDEEKQKFIYSKKNRTPIYDSTNKIVKYMNDRFSTFHKAGTSGEDVLMDKSLFYEWIKSYYLDKNVKFFITKSKDYLIFPTEKFSDYFDVSCCYRTKRSGSSKPVKSNIKEIETALKEKGIQGKMGFEGKELYLKTFSNIDGQKLTGTKYSYLFNETEKNKFLVRRLSNTNNSNVIFSISLKKDCQDKTDLIQFIDSI